MQKPLGGTHLDVFPRTSEGFLCPLMGFALAMGNSALHQKPRALCWQHQGTYWCATAFWPATHASSLSGHVWAVWAWTSSQAGVGGNPSKREMHLVLPLFLPYQDVRHGGDKVALEDQGAQKHLRGAWHTSKFFATSYMPLGPIWDAFLFWEKLNSETWIARDNLVPVCSPSTLSLGVLKKAPRGCCSFVVLDGPEDL